MRLYHDGSNSYVSDVGTGDLRLSGNVVKFNNQNNTATMVKATEGSSVELNFNNSKKFETTGIGVSIVNGTSDTATITGPSNLIIDPVVVGDNTGIVRIKGDLFVDGTTTQINSTSVEIADFIVGIASTATTDLLSDGAGIKIGPNNTFLYEHNAGANPSLKSSENLNVATGKGYQVNQVEVLNATTLGSSVVNSSLTSVGTLGSLTVSGNVSIADKIVHTGDTNTAIRFPTSDTFTVETSGSERLRITSSGQVSIAADLTQSTDAKLTVEGSAALTNLDQTLMVRDSNTDDAVGNGGFIGFAGFVNNVPRTLAGIRGIKSSTGNNFNGDLAFYTRQNGVADLSEKFRITSDGRFGFGTGANIDERGHIETSTGTCRLKLQTGNTGVAGFVLQTSAKRFDVQAQNNFFQIYDHSASTERLRIDSSGRLLVGITSSSGDHILEVNSGTDNEGIKVVSTDAGSYIRFADNSTTAQIRLDITCW